jgi:hypothetical protein
VDRLSKRLVVGLAVIAAVAVSGIALAAEGDDTVLNYGYDQNSQFFFWNVTSLEYGPDGELLDQTTDEEAQLEALLAACGLEGVEATFTFDPVTGVITVTSPDIPDPGEIVCGEFSGGDVTGPAGQVNHGMFLKLLNETYDGEHRGCIVSQIAQSGLGKGDQQVQAEGNDEEPIPDPEVEPEVVEGTVTFTTVTTDCQHGKRGPDTEEDETEESDGNGPPQKVLDKFGGQHPRDANGKPADAPGGRP